MPMFVEKVTLRLPAEKRVAEHPHWEAILILFFITTITTLGEPQDIALHDIKIECFFPADAHSRAVLEGLAEG